MQELLNQVLPYMREVHFYALAIALVTYLLRGILMLAGSEVRNSKLLLLFATLGFLGLAVSGAAMMMGSYGLISNMAISKATGLIGFIVFGLVAFKPGLIRIVGLIFWLIGLAFFVYAMLVIRQMAPMVPAL